MACSIVCIGLCVCRRSEGLGWPGWISWHIRGLGYLFGCFSIRRTTACLVGPVETRTSRKVNANSNLSPKLKKLSQDPGLLRRWAESEIHAEKDLLGMSCVAKRLAEYLANDLTSIRTAGVVGEFGAGKTSIVKWLKHDLALRNANHSTKVITCEVSCWGFEDSALASEYILKEAVKIVGEHVDCFWFRSLPEAYRKSFSAGGDWMRNVSDILIGSADAYEQFERLSQMLECLLCDL